jgi:hypothetical protein
MSILLTPAYVVLMTSTMTLLTINDTTQPAYLTCRCISEMEVVEEALVVPHDVNGNSV